MPQNDAEQAFSPVAATPQKKKPSLGQIFQSIDRKVTTNPAYKAIKEFSQLPAEGVNAALGAPQRVMAARIANLQRNPLGVMATQAGPLVGPLAMLFPRGREELGNEVYAAFHPNDMSIERAAEGATGVNRLMSKDPRFRGKLQNFAVRTAFETVTDPLTLATFGTAPAGEAALRGLGRIGTEALMSPDEAVRRTASTLLTNVSERQGRFTPEEIATINTVRQRAITHSRVQHTADEELLRKHAGQLKQNVIPPPVRQRLLREPYVYGTPEMRSQAVKLGYEASPAEAIHPPQGLLEYNLRKEYEPNGMVKHPTTFDDSLVGEDEPLRAPKGGFEKQQTGLAAPPESLYDRISRRLAASRSVVKHRSMVRDFQQHLKVGKDMAKGLATESRVTSFPPMQAISKAQVDALLATGVPHMRNVGVAGFLSMGEGGVTNAARYFLTGVPKELASRLEQGGASHFGIRTPAKYSPSRVIPGVVRKGMTRSLDRWDNALRAARLQQVDREFPKMSEFEKLDRVNQDLGAYNLKPHYVKLMQGLLGANFPQWHNYIVPTMVTRAVFRHPGRVERLARSEQNANDEFLGDKPYRITLGGPLDEAASAAADPARIFSGKYPSYFGGPSSAGPLSTLLRPSYGPPAERAAQIGSSFIPGGPTALDVLLNPFKSPLPAAGRALGGVTGLYSQKRTPGSISRTLQAPPAGTAQGDPFAGIKP